MPAVYYCDHASNGGSYIGFNLGRVWNSSLCVSIVIFKEVKKTIGFNAGCNKKKTLRFPVMKLSKNAVVWLI